MTPGAKDSPSAALGAALEVVGPVAGGVRVAWTLRNEGREAVHLLRTERMPYVIVDAPDRVKLAWSIQPQDPDLDYYGIEIPITLALAPGAVERGEVTLKVPLEVHDHFSQPHPHGGSLAPRVALVAEFGYIHRAIAPAARVSQPYAPLVDEQQRVTSPPVTVDLQPGSTP